MRNGIGTIARSSQGLEQLVPPQAEVVEDWLQYVFEWSLVANGTGILPLRVAADGPFDLIKIIGLDTKDGNYELRIQDEKSGKYLQQGGLFIDARNTIGTSQRPYYIEGRRRFEANSAIIIEVRDISAAPNNIQLTLHGIKVLQ